MHLDALQLIEDRIEARELGALRRYREQLKKADLLAHRRPVPAPAVPAGSGDELAIVLMSRYEKASTTITLNRVVEDWPKVFGAASSWRRCTIG